VEKSRFKPTMKLSVVGGATPVAMDWIIGHNLHFNDDPAGHTVWLHDPDGDESNYLSLENFVTHGPFSVQGSLYEQPGFNVEDEATTAEQINELAHLGPNSPAINRGKLASIFVDPNNLWTENYVAIFDFTDLDGEQRPQHGLVDMGADERSGPLGSGETY